MGGQETAGGPEVQRQPEVAGVSTEEVLCGECGSPMVIRYTRKYPNPDGSPRAFYGCKRYPDCDGIHGAHQKDLRPLGIPANKETKKARMRAHEAFDRIWKTKVLGRKDAYAWMCKTMGLSKEEAHIGRFDTEKCDRLVSLVNEFLAQAGRFRLQP